LIPESLLGMYEVIPGLVRGMYELIPYLTVKSSTEVIDFFTDKLMAIRPTDDERILEFMNYVFDNYISPEVCFPPSIWAQFSTTLNRTTISFENFHLKLNSRFYSGHSNIYVLIDELLEIQSETYIICRSNENYIMSHQYTYTISILITIIT